MKAPRCVLFCLLMSAVSACGAKGGDVSDTEHSFRVALQAVSATEAPLPGVAFEMDGAPVGITNQAGMLVTRVRGTAGQTLAVRATCPAGYEGSGTQPLRLAHTRALGSEAAEALSVRAACVKKLAQLAIVIHAPQGTKLPVMVDGAALGTTDEAGSAHFLLSIERTVPTVRVSLDTTGSRLLMPQHPSRTFELHGEDAILVFDQTFSVRRRTKDIASSKVPARRIPQRLD